MFVVAPTPPSSENWRKMPSPWTCVAGTQLGAVRPIGARRSRRSTALVGRLDAREAEQRVHLAQPLEEQDAREVLLEALGHVRLLAHEVRIVRGRREHVPLGPLQIEVLVTHRATAMDLDGFTPPRAMPSSRTCRRWRSPSSEAGGRSPRRRASQAGWDGCWCPTSPC